MSYHYKTIVRASAITADDDVRLSEPNSLIRIDIDKVVKQRGASLVLAAFNLRVARVYSVSMESVVSALDTDVS